MTDDINTLNKSLMGPLRGAMADFDEHSVRSQLHQLLSPDACIHLCAPFGDVTGPDAFYDVAYAPLLTAWPDLERRDAIVVAGVTEEGVNWVGCQGTYLGSFFAPWLDIPPTGHLAHIRYHEFYRFEAQQVVEIQAIWDIPEVMLQAGAWPMAPSLGREWCVPGPATQDGLCQHAYDLAISTNTRVQVQEMLEFMARHPRADGPEVMDLKRFWHPRMNWYGPAGIGTARGLAGFRHWHQIPFLKAMPDRGQDQSRASWHLFADGHYAAITGWPNMIQTLEYDGWLGIAPRGQTVTLRSLDFWRVERGLIRENWVLIDVLDLYAQVGVDVFARLREFNKAKTLEPIHLPREVL